MTRMPVLMLTAATAGGVLFVVALLEYVASFVFITVSGWVAFPTVLVELAVEAVFFAAGLFLAWRIVVPIRSDSSWRTVVVRGFLASVIGALAIVVGMTLAGFIGSIGPGSHPFGYAFTPTLEIAPLANWAFQTAETAFRPFIENIPLVVLASVFLKVRLNTHDASIEARDRASASA